MDDDVLNDEEEEEEDLEEVEKALLDATHEEEHILKSPSPDEKATPVPQHKKVLLKRKHVSRSKQKTFLIINTIFRIQ